MMYPSGKQTFSNMMILLSVSFMRLLVKNSKACLALDKRLMEIMED